MPIYKARTGTGGSLNDLGYFVDETALTTAHPTANDGNFAIVGSTDTVWVWDSGTVAWVDTGNSASGDMLAAIYDPTSVAGDAFDMANMAENLGGLGALILTTAERTKLSGIESLADVTDTDNVLDALDSAFIPVTTLAAGDQVLLQDVSDSSVIRTVDAQDIANLATGADTEIHFNDGAVSTGDPDLTWNKTAERLSAKNLRVPTLNTGDKLLTTDGDGDVLESDVGVVAAPAGGSGFIVEEYAVTPTPVAGMLWIEAKDANTKTLKYYNGVSTFGVDLSV